MHHINTINIWIIDLLTPCATVKFDRELNRLRLEQTPNARPNSDLQPQFISGCQKLLEVKMNSCENKTAIKSKTSQFKTSSTWQRFYFHVGKRCWSAFVFWFYVVSDMIRIFIHAYITEIEISFLVQIYDDFSGQIWVFALTLNIALKEKLFEMRILI